MRNYGGVSGQGRRECWADANGDGMFDLSWSGAVLVGRRENFRRNELRREDWNDGRVEEWKTGMMEEWNTGRVEGWRVEEWKSEVETQC
jgi:hypothetical protein